MHCNRHLQTTNETLAGMQPFKALATAAASKEVFGELVPVSVKLDYVQYAMLVDVVP